MLIYNRINVECYDFSLNHSAACCRRRRCNIEFDNVKYYIFAAAYRALCFHFCGPFTQILYICLFRRLPIVSNWHYCSYRKNVALYVQLCGVHEICTLGLLLQQQSALHVPVLLHVVRITQLYTDSSRYLFTRQLVTARGDVYPRNVGLDGDLFEK